MKTLNHFRTAQTRILVGGLLCCAAVVLPCASARADEKPRVLLAKNSNADKELLGAATSGDMAKLTAALEAGADINKTDKEGRSALMLAAKSGQAELVELLLGRGAGADMQDKSGQTALMLATQFGAPAPAKKKGGLLGKLKDKLGENLKGQMGGMLDSRLSGLGKVGSSLMGNVPLHAMLGENIDLLMAGKGLNLGNVSNWKAIAGTGLIGDAQAGGTIGLVPVLSGDLRVMGASDWSKLVRSVEKANPQVLKAMKTLDIENDVAAQKWAKFVGLAQGDNQQPMAQMLADPVLKPLLTEARTSLMSAVSELPGQRIQQTVSGLLSAGANANLTDKENRSALDLARERELEAIVQILENNGNAPAEEPQPVAEEAAGQM